MNYRILFLTISLLIASLFSNSSLQAQEGLLTQRISAQYEQVPLALALQDMSRRYGVRFSFSADMIPSNMLVSINRTQAPLNQVLDELFAKSTVVYRLIGDQVVLTLDPNKHRSATPERRQPNNLYLAQLEVARQPLHYSSNETTIQPGIVLEAVDPRQHQAQEMRVSENTANAPSSFEIAWQGSFEKDTARETYPVRPIQLSFITPLGTNGLESGKIVNRLSINLFAGYAGGVDGVELGGFLNVDRSDVNGVQLAGFGNVVGGKTQAFQAAGFFNVNKSSTHSAQAAGFVNVVGDSMIGFQAAGFVNVVKKQTTGTQLAGFTNVTGGNVEAWQAAGFANIAKGDVTGAQTAGFLNTAKDIDGFQAAGFLNIARKLNGVQLGFINVVDSVESGVPIGFLSFVRKNGYRKFELSASESLYANAAFKIGVPRLYNIFTVGVQPGTDYSRWAVGYGLGTEKRLSPSTVVNLEGIYSHVNEDEVWTTELNELIQLKLAFGYQIKGLTIFGGPTCNLLISRFYDEQANRLGSQLAPWTFYDQNRSSRGSNFFPTTNLQMWAGLTGGIRF